MSNGNVFERLWKQQVTVGKLVLDGKRDPEEVCHVLQEIISPTRLAEVGRVVESWTLFYKKHFGLDLNMQRIRISEHQLDFDRLLVVAKGLTLNKVYEECAKQFPCWRHENDLDKAVPTNDRDPKNGSYAVWVRDRVEADEENKSLSANQLKERGTQGITLLERMIYELKYFDETGKHLDETNVTLCTGSRHSDGYVPCVDWHSGRRKVYVNWYSPDDSDGDLRSRSAVS